MCVPRNIEIDAMVVTLASCEYSVFLLFGRSSFPLHRKEKRNNGNIAGEVKSQPQLMFMSSKGPLPPRKFARPTGMSRLAEQPPASAISDM